MKTTSIYELAEKLNAKVWEKGDLKRIYLNDEGYNTKKMSTKAYIFQNESGEFKVSVRIECYSQSINWITSQEEEVKKSIEKKIEKALADTYYIPTRKADGKVFDDGTIEDRDEFMLYPDVYLTAEAAIASLKSEDQNPEDYDIVAISREEAEAESEALWAARKAAKEAQA